MKFFSNFSTWHNLFLFLLLLHLFFPHASILKLSATDNQIDSSLLAIFYIYANRFFSKETIFHSSKLIRFHLLLGFCGVYLCLLGASYNVFDAKSLIAFLNLFLFSYLAQLFKGNRTKLFQMLLILCSIGFLVGLAQALIHPNAMGFLVRHIRTDPSRGLTGLSSEPFFYGLHTLSVFFAIRILYGLIPKSKFNQIAAISAFFASTISIFMFSKSSLCILLFSFYLVLEIIFSKNIRWIVYTLIISVILIPTAPLLLSLFKTRRIDYLLQVIPHQGFNIFKLDLSFKSRWMDIETSLRHFYAQLPWTEGFGSGNWHGLNAYMNQNLVSSNLGWPITYKALSGFGNTIFELGWLGVILMFVFLKLFYDCKHFNAKALSIIFFIILLGSVSLSTPFLGFLLGIVLWDAKETASHLPPDNHSSERTVARKESNPSSKDLITSPA